MPLIAVAFTPIQEDLIRCICRDWALATAPADPDAMEGLIRSAVQALSLADLLSPEATGMLRFPTLLQLQTAGKGNFGLARPLWDTSTRIHIPATDDEAEFRGQLNIAIFWFLSGKGIIPDSCFPGIGLQALYDIGVFFKCEAEAPACLPIEEKTGISDFFKEGITLSRNMESVTDIRTLFRVVLAKTSDDAFRVSGSKAEADITRSVTDVEQQSGHLLAGFVSASEDATHLSRLNQVLDFIRFVAAPSSGRISPGSGKVRELERNLQELEQLIRAVTGDYSWRAVPMAPGTGGYRPFVDLWPDRHLILYDQDEMAYRSPEASKASVMEALYRQNYGIRGNW